MTKTINLGAVIAMLALVAISGCHRESNEQAKTTVPAAPAPPPAPTPPPPAPTPPPAAMPAEAPPPEISANLTPAPTQPGDVPDSHDPGFLKRYQGSHIIAYQPRSFDQIKLPVPDPAKPGEMTTETYEGSVTRSYYRIPVGHTALEIFRNYQDAAKGVGFAIAHEHAPCKGDWRRDPSDQIYNEFTTSGFKANPFVSQNGSWAFAATDGPYCDFTAKGAKNGQAIALAVAVVEMQDPDTLDLPVKDVPPIKMNKGEVLVLVDTVVSKAVVIQMVTVKAADMADALSSKGFIDLYGIYFDTDKSDVKPASTATLDEVASLLKIDRALTLEVSGHTDNSGATAHNLELSQARAAAVVQALVSHYGIDAKRLIAKGYGDTKPVAPNDSDANKAKNRRVELRKN